MVYVAFFSDTGTNIPTTPAPITRDAPKVARKAKTLDALIAMPPEQLADVDIAEMNLLCAAGLPGAENLGIDKCLATLDQWAARVKFETERHLYRAHDPQWADHYKHSENWLRAEMLAQVLNQDCGVHYNMERIRDIDFRNSKDLLIHGMIDDPNGGTCASMPALYMAVGRRLGYPLKMVLARGHIFVRWDDGHERFNIETTGNGGTDSYPDEHYKQWPEKITDAEVKKGRYLISLSPAEELATFLANRGHCLLDNGHPKEAFDAYAAAHRLAPLDPAYSGWMRQAEVRFRPQGRMAIDPRGFRQPRPGNRGRPMMDVRAINAHNRRLMEQRMRPSRPNGQQPGAPQPYQPPTPGPPRP
ncbi:MAG: hypothetical protein GWP08_19510 [Nitrospiraceae bacterium]|nr:hypothetical protein [Nitrospiraceae bacterium]